MGLLIDASSHEVWLAGDNRGGDHEIDGLQEFDERLCLTSHAK